MDQLGEIRTRSAARAFPAAPRAAGTKSIIVAGLLVAVALVALLAAGQLIDFGVLHLRVRALNTDYHSSVFGVVSLLAEATAGATILWRGTHTQERRWAWLLLGAIVAGLVVVRALTTYNPKTVAVPLACMFCLVSVLTWRDPRAARTVVWAALVLMATSLLLHEVGLDADVLNYSDQSWSYQLTAVAKHGSELAGWVLLITGVIAGSPGTIASLRDRVRRPALHVPRAG
jgi:hypothetical protein